MATANRDSGWIELPTVPKKIPDVAHQAHHIEAIRDSLVETLRAHRNIYSNPLPLRDTPFPLLRAYAEALRRSPDFSRIMAHLLAGKYNITVLYVVAYAYDGDLFSYVHDDADLRASVAIREIVAIANNSDLANTLSILVASKDRQDSLRSHVRFSIRMKREHGETPTPAMLELVDELGADETCALIERYGYISPTQLRAIDDGISPSLSIGAL